MACSSRHYFTSILIIMLLQSIKDYNAIFLICVKMCSHVSTRVSPIGFFVAIVGVNVCYAYWCSFECLVET